MKISETIYPVVILIACIAVFFVFWQIKQPQGEDNLGGQGYGFATFATSSHMLVGLNPSLTYRHTTVLLASSTRDYAAIVNTGSNYVCLNLGATPAKNCEGIYLAPGGGSFEITRDNPFHGTITAIANSATTSVTVVESD